MKNSNADQDALIIKIHTDEGITGIGEVNSSARVAKAMIIRPFTFFRVALSYRDTMEQGYLPEEWFGENPPEGMDDKAAIANYGETVRKRLAEWLKRNSTYEGEVNTYYGTQTVSAFFERTVWHVAQHLRQLYAFLDLMDVIPENPLTDKDFAGLPLPKNVW